MESFIPIDLVRNIDFENCELLDKSFISEQYKKRESDVVYKVKFKKIAENEISIEKFEQCGSHLVFKGRKTKP